MSLSLSLSLSPSLPLRPCCSPPAHTPSLKYTQRQTDGDGDRDRQSGRQRQTDRQTETERQTEKDRHRNRDREREEGTNRDRQRHTAREVLIFAIRGRNSSVGSVWARCPQGRGFDPPLGKFSSRGDFSLGVNMGSNSIPPKTLSDESINRGLVCAHMRFIARTQKILMFMS